jgi:hypothetical protein
VINATDGCVTGVKMKIIIKKINRFTKTLISNERTYDNNYLHKLFGHCGQETLNNTFEMYGFKTSGKFKTCEQCAIGKAEQKNLNNNFLGSSNVPG